MKKSELEMKIKDFRTKIETASQTISDENAQSCVALYPRWNDDTHYLVGYRVQYDDIVYKCLQEHDSQSMWTPSDTPSLWVRVHLENVIEDWVQPDNGDNPPYNKGDKVRYNGHIYESTIDNNVWSPDAYSAGWKEV